MLRNTKVGTKLVFSISLVLTLVMTTGMVWNIRSQKKQANSELLEQGRILAVQVMAIRAVAFENQKKINYDSKGNFEFKHLNPTTIVQQVGRVFNDNTNYLIRQIRFNPRLLENKPDDYEKSQLQRFNLNKKLKELSGVSEINGERYFRYMVPLYYSKACLTCHGEPKGQIDVSGYPKEGSKIGELAGAVSIAIPTKLKDGNLNKAILQSIFITFLSILFSAGILYFQTKRFVSKPIDSLIRFSYKLGRGNLTIRPEDFRAYGEILELKNRFTQMANDLQELYDNLELKVKERTYELATINKELAKVNGYKSEFLAMMSHEFRTPLTAILSFTGALIKKNIGSLSREQEDYLKEIQDSGKQLLIMVNDLLDLSKINSGKMALNLTEVDIGLVVYEVQKKLSPLAEEKQITIKTEILGNQKVIADRTKVSQVIQNLLGNAIKFSPLGTVVEVEVVHVVGPVEGVNLIVIDSGPGIALEDQERIFDPFYQADRSLNREFPGSGLGLALVKKIIDMHLGWVGLESGIGQGAIFKVFWPAYPLLDKDLE